MLRIRLLTAAAATALMAGSAFAQTPPAPTTPQTPPAAMAPAATPAPATAATPAPATPAAPAAATQTAQANSVVDVLKSSGQFTTLLSALDQAVLTETLASRDAITIFAPTDAAFAALPEADRTRLMDPANAQELRNLLLYHVIVADVTEDQIEGARGAIDTAGGAKIQLDGTGDAIKADNATVTAAALDASNGAVFPIDQVLNPANSLAAMGDEDEAAPAAPAAATTPAPAAAPAPAATTPAAPAPAAAPTTPAAPAAPATTTTTRPAMPGETAPSGQPAGTVSTTRSAPVPNPTDGQVDSPNAATATPPVEQPNPASDGESEDGDEPADPPGA